MWRKHARHYCTHKETDLQSLSALVCWAAEVYGCRESRKPFPQVFVKGARVEGVMQYKHHTEYISSDCWYMDFIICGVTAVMVWRQKWAKALGKRNLPCRTAFRCMDLFLIFYNKVEPLSTLEPWELLASGEHPPPVRPPFIHKEEETANGQD